MADRPAAAAAGDSQPGAAAPLPVKLCAFCGGGANAYGGQLGKMQGPFFTSSKGHDAVYVHHECALWSPQVRGARCRAFFVPSRCGLEGKQTF